MAYTQHRTEFKIELDDLETSDPYIFEHDIISIVITLSFPDGSGIAKAQTTTSTREDINADSAVWVDWTAGSVVTTTQNSMRAPSAIRLVNEESNPAKCEVRPNIG